MSPLPGATMKRILEEPLLHFLLLGVGLFVVYGLLSQPGRQGVLLQSLT